MNAVVVGGGVFGLSSALALVRRGAKSVTLLEACRMPAVTDTVADFMPGRSCEGTSVDVSRMVRPDYAGDNVYTPLMLEAMRDWATFNERHGGREVFHHTGWLALRPGGELPRSCFERLCIDAMEEEGVEVTSITGKDVAERYPAWGSRYQADDVRGFSHGMGGWAHSGMTVACMADEARAEGVDVRDRSPVARVLRHERSGAAEGVELVDGTRLNADVVVVAAGLWTPRLVPELEGCMRSVAQPVFYVTVPPAVQHLFTGESFPPFSADITATGYYGFPLNGGGPGVMKVGNHGEGEPGREPEGGRDVAQFWHGDFRAWLAETFPTLADAEVNSACCFYEDSWDGHFYIDSVPGSEGLLLATGGSGHGFKFAPVIGDLVVDSLEGKANPYLHRFAFRERQQVGEAVRL